MGYQAYSYAVFGIKTSRKNMKQTVQARGCHHTISEGMKFCPECGEPAFIEEEEDILESMNDKGLSYYYSDYDRDTEVILGFCVGQTSYSKDNVACTPPTPGMAAEILEFCKEHNLPYTEKNIKMYVMTYHSY